MFLDLELFFLASCLAPVCANTNTERKKNINLLIFLYIVTILLGK